MAEQNADNIQQDRFFNLLTQSPEDFKTTINGILTQYNQYSTVHKIANAIKPLSDGGSFLGYLGDFSLFIVTCIGIAETVPNGVDAWLKGKKILEPIEPLTTLLANEKFQSCIEYINGMKKEFTQGGFKDNAVINAIISRCAESAQVMQKYLTSQFPQDVQGVPGLIEQIRGFKENDLKITEGLSALDDIGIYGSYIAYMMQFVKLIEFMATETVNYNRFLFTVKALHDTHGLNIPLQTRREIDAALKQETFCSQYAAKCLIIGSYITLSLLFFVLKNNPQIRALPFSGSNASNEAIEGTGSGLSSGMYATAIGLLTVIAQLFMTRWANKNKKGEELCDKLERLIEIRVEECMEKNSNNPLIKENCQAAIRMMNDAMAEIKANHSLYSKVKKGLGSIWNGLKHAIRPRQRSADYEMPGLGNVDPRREDNPVPPSPQGSDRPLNASQHVSDLGPREFGSLEIAGVNSVEGSFLRRPGGLSDDRLFNDDLQEENKAYIRPEFASLEIGNANVSHGDLSILHHNRNETR